MSSKRSKHDEGIPLSIAGLCILVSGENAGLMDKVYDRYHLYSISGKDAHRLTLHIVSKQSGSTTEQITISDSRLTITHQTYEGVIDFRRDASTLTLIDGHALADLEYFLRLVCAYLGFQAGGFLIHSAGVVSEGYSYLFFGPSGSGKSTVANLSTQNQVLNDDLVMLLPGKDHWEAFSTPFWNQGRGLDSRPIHAAVAGMYRLVQDVENFLEPVSRGEALAELMACIPVISRSPAFSAGLFQRCSALLNRTPVYRLHFTPDNSFWDVVRLSR